MHVKAEQRAWSTGNTQERILDQYIVPSTDLSGKGVRGEARPLSTIGWGGDLLQGRHDHLK